MVGADATTISKIESGKINPSLDFVLNLADALHIQPHRLFSDEPLVPKPVADKQPIIMESFPDAQTHDEFSEVEAQDNFIPIRIVGTVSLGQGRIISGEETEGYALIYRHALNRKAWHQKRSAEKIVCVWAKGSSMTPTIQDKSLVAIDIEDRGEIRNQKIYAVELPDQSVDRKSVV